MPFKVAMLRGYQHPPTHKESKMKKHHRKHHRKFGSHASKFKAAAKACKGKKIGAFRACMRSKLKGR